jgi:hypothetical protein
MDKKLKIGIVITAIIIIGAVGYVGYNYYNTMQFDSIIKKAYGHDEIITGKAKQVENAIGDYNFAVGNTKDLLDSKQRLNLENEINEELDDEIRLLEKAKTYANNDEKKYLDLLIKYKKACIFSKDFIQVSNQQIQAVEGTLPISEWTEINNVNRNKTSVQKDERREILDELKNYLIDYPEVESHLKNLDIDEGIYLGVDDFTDIYRW